MAEFVVVMRQWKRMCEDTGRKSKDKSYGCDTICPLRENVICETSIDEQSIQVWEDAEKKIMSWAAEHPEPKYPTWLEWWLEWLHTTSATDGSPDIPVGDGTIFRVAINDIPIPADIAQKLGIEPKEE